MTGDVLPPAYPWRLHQAQPADAAARELWAVELLLYFAVEYEEPDLWAVARAHRPDLSDEQFSDAGWRLADLSVDAADLEATTQRRQYEFVTDTYYGVLMDLARKPEAP